MQYIIDKIKQFITLYNKILYYTTTIVTIQYLYFQRYSDKSKQINPGNKDKFNKPGNHTANSFYDADYWLHRGNICSSHETAIDCYRQGLKINRNHTELLYNLGCKYEQCGDCESSLKCFTHLSSVHNNMCEAFYGMALCAFKLGKFPDALKYIEEATLNFKGVNRQHYIYLRALCYKQLERFEEATQYYSEFHDILNDLDGKPRGKSWDMTPLCSKNNVTKYSDSRPKNHNFVFKNPLILQYYDTDEGCKADNRQKVRSLLHAQPFFCRYNFSHLEQIIKIMKVQSHTNSLLFISSKQIIVVLQGSGIIYSHTQQLSKPQIISKFRKGDILGYTTDGGVSRNPENWIKAETALELCIFNYSDFEFIWFLQKGLVSKEEREIVAKIPIFKGLTEQSIHLLVLELFSIIKKTKGNTLCKISKNSPFTFVSSHEKIKQGILNLREPQKYRRRCSELRSSYSDSKNKKNVGSNLFQESAQGIYNDISKEIIGSLREKWENIQDYSKAVSNMLEPDTDGFYYIIEGRCQVVSPIDGEVLERLSPGDFFGESQLLEVMGCNFFGDIISVTDVSCYFVSNSNFARIPEYEKEKMRASVEQRCSKMLFKCTDRYGGNPYKIKWSSSEI